MSSNDNNSTANRQAQDGFFIVSLTAWDRLFAVATKELKESDVVRVLAAYLTLSCGTGADHITSGWSSGSIRKYAGISQRPAERAIKMLAASGFIDIVKKPEKNKLPIYKIKFDKNPKDQDQSQDNMFIPNGVVMGVTNEDSPIRRLANYQNPHLLYLFIRLYYFQDKYLDVIDPSIVSSAISVHSSASADVVEVHNEGDLVRVWGLASYPLPAAYDTSEFYDFAQWYDKPNPINNKTYSKADAKGFMWIFLDTLRELSLVVPVVYVCNGSKATSADEIDFICQEKSQMQQKALQVLSDLSEHKLSNPIDEIVDYDCYAVLPADYRKVHFQAFYQMRYRTKLGEVRNRFGDEAHVRRTIGKLLEKAISKSKVEMF